MHSQEVSYSRSQYADFRNALARASKPQRSSLHGQAGKAAAVGPFEEYDPYHNRNISSIVSKITDEGPANLHQINKKTKKKSGLGRAKTDDLQLAEDTYTPGPAPQTDREQPPPPSFSFNGGESGEETKAAGLASSSVWYQSILLLLVVVIAVIGFFLYQLTIKADELSQALSSKEEAVYLAKEPQELRADVMIPRLDSLGETLSELKHELHEIKRDQKKGAEKQANDGPKKSVPLVVPVPMSNNRVAALKNDFKLIHNGTRDSAASQVAKQASSQLITHAKTQNKDKKNNNKTVKNVDGPNNLVVNLVSLTNRDKAQSVHDQLIQAGVSPLIEEVVVNDRKVYRLSVNGFGSRESAQDFIAHVKKNYGFDGGWIRHN